MISNSSSAGSSSSALRAPLDIDRVRASLAGVIDRIEYRSSTASTNTDAVAAAQAGAPAWTMCYTDHQSAGRGRHGRVWEAPVNAQLIQSMVIRPRRASLDRLGLLPLSAGLAVVDSLPKSIGAQLKWPNDVLIRGHKVCGILGEAVDLGANPALVIGLGVNYSLAKEELPVHTATSLLLEDPEFPLDRTELAIELAKNLKRRLQAWDDNDPQLLADFRAACATLGAEVKALLPNDEVIYGRATDIDDQGRLIIITTEGTRYELSAGDVTHLRLQDQAFPGE